MQIIYAFTRLAIPEKEARIAIGVRNVVRSNSGRLIPSTPRK
jgi:hypothetical protein